MALASGTRAAYAAQLRSFMEHAGISHEELLTHSARRIDRWLSLFIQHSYDAQRPYSYAQHALHAVVYHRQDLKLGGLLISRQCLRGWKNKHQVKSHPPLTWELTVVIACTLARSGYHAPAVAMLLGFDCYLRVSEITGLRRCDIVMSNDARMGRAHTGMAVCLPRSKTGLNQSVSVQNPDVATLLSHWIKSLPRTIGTTGRIFDFSPAWLGRLMRNACVSLGVGHIPYVPHSLRHGGATADFLRLGNVEHVHFRGRWKSIESLRTYIQQARALLAAVDVPEELNQLGIELSDSVVTAVLHCMKTIPEVVPRSHGRRVTFA